MYNLSLGHVIGIIVVLMLVLVLGVYAGKKIINETDFTVGGRKSSAFMVAGTIMGTLIGGSSTIGTAELAFQYGLDAWWFTLGAGIGCLILGIFLARSLRESGLETIPQFLVTAYGQTAAPIASVFSSIGIFLNVIAQMLAAIALLSSMFGLDPFPGAIIAVILVVITVVFGGVIGTGLVGILKLVLLYITLIITGLLAFQGIGGINGLESSFSVFPWLSLFGRGFSIDFAAGLSLIIGVLSTQTYIQAIFSGMNPNVSKKGAIIASILIPPCGIAGVLVGMYMKLNFPRISAAEAFPMFVLKLLPPWLGGIVLATLLVAVIGAAGGLSLGISTMLTKDIYQRFVRPQAKDKEMLFVTRGLLIGVLVLSILFVSGNLKLMILQWSFLSMGLRGAAIFFPLIGAIYFKQYVTPIGGIISIVGGSLADLVWKILFPQSIDPLYIGLIVSLIGLVIGSLIFSRSKPCLQK